MAELTTPEKSSEEKSFADAKSTTLDKEGNMESTQQRQQEDAEGVEERKRREAMLARSGAEPVGVAAGAKLEEVSAPSPTKTEAVALDLDRENAEIARRFRDVSNMAEDVKQLEKTGQPSDLELSRAFARESKELDAITENAFGGKLPPDWNGTVEVKGMVLASKEDEDTQDGHPAVEGEEVDYYDVSTKGSGGRSTVIATRGSEEEAKALTERLTAINSTAMQLPKVAEASAAAPVEMEKAPAPVPQPSVADDLESRAKTPVAAVSEAAPVELEKAPEPVRQSDVADDIEGRSKTPVAAVETTVPKKDETLVELKKEAASATAAALASAATGGQSATVSAASAAAASVGAGSAVKAIDDESEEKALNVTRKGTELERGEFIVPRRITQAYTEHEGKFFAKDTSRMMFHDQGEKLATSTTDKNAIADMVAYAKAKQWESLKLTGSQEFRREAWLQAESQGIKTQGFTPREKDLVELKTLTMERSTNSITPLQDRAKDRAQLEKPIAAPRHDLNKNQAATASAAAQNNTTNIKELQKDPAMERFSMEELSKIAFYRALVIEREKDAAPAVRDEAVAKFDTAMRDPAMVKALPDPEIKAEGQAQAKDKEHKRSTSELSL